MNNLVLVKVAYTEHDEHKPYVYMCSPEAAIAALCKLKDNVFYVKLYALNETPWRPDQGIYGFDYIYGQ